MKTLVLEKPGKFKFDNRPEVQLTEENMARVKIRRIGVCGTDLHAFKGDQPFFSYPRVLGHELGVEVMELDGTPKQVQVGDFCAVEPYLNCGTCAACRSGKTNCCEQLVVLGVHEDGGMTEEMLVPADKLHKSDTLPLEHLALVEMLCIGAHAVGRAKVTADDRVLVIGAGPIGLSVVQFALLNGAFPIVFDMDAQRLAFCKSFLGVDHCLHPGNNPETLLRDLFDGDLPDVVFDATGHAGSMHKAFNLVGAGGKLVFVGLVLNDITFYDPEFHRKEMTLLSTRNATAADFKFVIQMLESGQINLTPWITHRTGFGQVVDEFPKWLNREEGVVKAMIDLE